MLATGLGSALRMEDVRVRGWRLRLDLGHKPIGSMGGALYAARGAVVRALRCVFDGNAATKGGAVAVWDGSTDAQFVECQFRNNTADFTGPDVAHLSAGGSLYAHTTEVALDACAFEDSEAAHGGCVAAVGASLNVTGASSFRRCAARRSAGAAAAAEYAPLGGAVHAAGYLAGLDVSGAAAFEDCEARGDGGRGGALFLDTRAGAYTVAGARLARNAAAEGAAVEVQDGRLALNECTLQENRASVSGVLVVSGAGASVHASGAWFLNGTAPVAPTVVIGADAAAVFESCVFAGNAAGGASGAELGAEGSNATFVLCEFYDNAAAGSAAVFSFSGAARSSASFVDCSFSRNRAEASGGVGRASGSASASLVLDGCVFRDNAAASGNGGALDVEDPARPRLSRAAFERNSAPRGAGGALFDEGAAACDGCHFEGNTALVGGAVAYGPGAQGDEGAACVAPLVAPVFGDGNAASQAGNALFWFDTEPRCADACEGGTCAGLDDSEVYYPPASVRAAAGGAASALPGGRFNGTGVLEAAVVDFRGRPVTAPFAAGGEPLSVSFGIAEAGGGGGGADDASTAFGRSVAGVPVDAAGVARLSGLPVRALPGEYEVTFAVDGDACGSCAPGSLPLAVSGCTRGAADRAELLPPPSAAASPYGAECLRTSAVPPSSSRDWLLAASVLALLLLAFAALALWRHRGTRLVEVSQPRWLALVLGSAFAAVVAVNVDYASPPSSSACALAPWLLHPAVVVFLGALLAKIQLVVRNNVRVRYRTAHTDMRLPLHAGVPSAAAVAVMLAWTAAGLPSPGAFEEDDDGAAAAYDADGVRFARVERACGWDGGSRGFVVFFLLFEAALVAAGVVQAVRTGHVRTRFDERRRVANAFYAAALVLGAGLVALLFTGHGLGSSARFFAWTYFSAVAAASAAMAAPMLRRVAAGKANDETVGGPKPAHLRGASGDSETFHGGFGDGDDGDDTDDDDGSGGLEGGFGEPAAVSVDMAVVDRETERRLAGAVGAPATKAVGLSDEIEQLRAVNETLKNTDNESALDLLEAEAVAAARGGGAPMHRPRLHEDIAGGGGGVESDEYSSSSSDDDDDGEALP